MESRNPLQEKPFPHDPIYYKDFPVRGDLVKFSHYGAPLSFEVLAEASFDGVWEAFRLAKRGWNINVPDEEFKRTTPNFQLDIGSDLYSESDFALHDLALLINLIFGWGKYYQPREFQIQWFKQGKPYVLGTLRKGSRLVSGSTNSTATA